jgi:hypothetical protein
MILDNFNLSGSITPGFQLILVALHELKKSTGIEGTVGPSQGWDATVTLNLAGSRRSYNCDIKPNIDRFHTLTDLKARSAANDGTLLISRALSYEMASHCRELEIQFIDAAGNAYITDHQGLLVYVAGRKIKDGNLIESEATITPAALRAMFAILSAPAMLNSAYRDLSQAANISVGAIGKIWDTLENRGFIGTTVDGRRIIKAAEALLSEWATGYLSRLRPKLRKLRFSADNPGDILSWNPQLYISAWGGEVAADIVTKHLQPAAYTIYMDMKDGAALSELVKRFRLRADPNGAIEVLDTFWNMNKLPSFPTVPLPLIYADLLGTNDSRNLTVAKQIASAVINHA